MKWVLFDLDGTLLSLKNEEFSKIYFTNLALFSKIDISQLVTTITDATNFIINENNGKLTNENAYNYYFKKYFQTIDSEIFYQFYYEQFDQCKKVTSTVPQMIESIKILKEKGYKLALLTNPLFPRIATYKRISWAGLNIQDFELITTFENFNFAKPDTRYYQQALEKLNIEPAQALMVGNDVNEDMIVSKLGIATYLVTDNLIGDPNTVECDYVGSSQQFLNFVKTLN